MDISGRSGVDEPERLQPRTQAAVAVAWVIAANKPVYPLYVWWLAGADAALGTLATMLGAPLYLAVPFLARRSAFGARALLVVVGLVDTLFITKLLGAASATELFLFACALLALVCFEAREHAFSRAATAIVFVSFVVLHGRYGAALNGWSDATAAKLVDLHAYSVASLAAFIGWRFARL
jgi:hypothetical protein